MTHTVVTVAGSSPAPPNHTYHHGNDQGRRGAVDNGRPFTIQAASVGVAGHRSGGAHVVHATRRVALAQVVEDGVEGVVLVQVAAVGGNALQHTVHGGRRRIHHLEALRQTVLLLPASLAQVGPGQVQVVGHHVLVVTGGSDSTTVLDD